MMNGTSIRRSSSLLRQDVLGVEMQHHVPSQRLDARDQAMKHVEIGHAAQVLDEIEADAANPARVQALQFRVRHRLLDAGDTTIAAPARGDRIQRHGHVRSVTARVHDDGARDAEMTHAACADSRPARRAACSCGPRA